MSALPDHVRREVERILDREARRLLVERLEREAEDKPAVEVEREEAA